MAVKARFRVVIYTTVTFLYEIILKDFYSDKKLKMAPCKDPKGKQKMSERVMCLKNLKKRKCHKINMLKVGFKNKNII